MRTEQEIVSQQMESDLAVCQEMLVFSLNQPLWVSNEG